MCRRPKATSKRRERWICGQRGLVNWCYYWGPSPSKRRATWWVNDRGVWKSLSQLVKEWRDMAKRPSVESVLNAGGGLGPSYGEISKHCPQICSWLCDTTYEDGSKKGRVRLQAERKADRIELDLKCEDSGLHVVAAHESLTDALLTLELLLGHDDCPWQLDPFPIGRTKKGGKK